MLEDHRIHLGSKDYTYVKNLHILTFEVFSVKNGLLNIQSPMRIKQVISIILAYRYMFLATLEEGVLPKRSQMF